MAFRISLGTEMHGCIQGTVALVYRCLKIISESCIVMSFTVFYCTSCIAFFFFLLLILSICLSVCLLFVCL